MAGSFSAGDGGTPALPATLKRTVQAAVIILIIGLTIYPYAQSLPAARKQRGPQFPVLLGGLLIHWVLTCGSSSGRSRNGTRDRSSSSGLGLGVHDEPFHGGLQVVGTDATEGVLHTRLRRCGQGYKCEQS